ncbi:mandelate racemase/muconate lactonizing enzyme family protein [Mitsuaria sp. GD03876]|uniref:mandelate racemase/muconate lactonizing enzyme family protein n=1 Tax=Mitsuaria sp. GD03876 TaxID=2975399 RepID=UPI00244BCC17|nr:mandelate racemase/muconate lactonizing enzyme family protein [Mitsuaria sp. GD03876]MDH0867348.1 mandelate racemase/muconate lactonizing enzyme family protein [Mitsuaria sp. GD03876]
MKIVQVEQFRAEGGLRPLCFLKVTGDGGLAGWSEYSELLGGAGVGELIARMAAGLVGTDPRDTARLSQRLEAQTRSASGGLNAQAAAAIENACLDLKAKALDVPVHELFGGAVRDRLPAYWSHFGMHRVRAAHQLGREPLRTLDDLAAMLDEARDRGYRTLKTNVMLFGDAAPRLYMPGFGRDAGGPGLNLDGALLQAIAAQMGALRAAAGPAFGLALDLNFNFKPSGVRRIAQALEPMALAWLETDLPDPAALAALRQATRTPIASLETLVHRRQVLPYLTAQAVDYAIVDVMWAGLGEAVRIAALAGAHDVNLNTHVFSSPLATAMAAHLGAIAPNFHLMELDVDTPPWVAAMFHQRLQVVDGELLVPAGPGWGIEPDESALRVHAVEVA